MAKKEIGTELVKASAVKRTEGEEEQSFLSRIVRKIAALDNDEWEALSAAAQSWYNDAAEAMNKKKDIDGFEDDAPKRRTAPPAEEEAPKARGTKAKDPEPEDDEPAAPVVGDTVKVTNDKGEKFKGVVTEIDEKNLVMDVDGEEEVFRIAKLKDVQVVGGKKAEAKEEEAPKAKDPEIGDEVEVTLKDGEIKAGKLLELDEKNVVIEIDGEEEPFRMSKVASIAVKAGKAAKPAAKKEAPAEDEPKAKTTTKAKKDPDVKPATIAAREVICANLSKDKTAIAKMLEKQGVDIKGSTLDITFSDTHKTVGILRDLGLLTADA